MKFATFSAQHLSISAKLQVNLNLIEIFLRQTGLFCRVQFTIQARLNVTQPYF